MRAALINAAVLTALLLSCTGVALADTPNPNNPAAYYGSGLTGYESPASQGWGGGTTFADVAAYAISVVNSVVFVLASLALLIFMWGVFQYIYSAGAKKNRKFIPWSLIALFVLFSIWGILRIACNSFLPGTTCSSNGSTTSSSPLP